MSNLKPINPYYIIKQLQEELAEAQAEIESLKAQISEDTNE